MKVGDLVKYDGNIFYFGIVLDLVYDEDYEEDCAVLLWAHDGQITPFPISELKVINEDR